MKRILVYITLLSIVLLLVTTAITGCASEKSRGLAVYLTRDDIEPERLQDIDLVALSDSPIIAAEDIVSYNAQTYEIKLSREAFERICNLEVPTSGKSFVVCVDDEQIYRGAFWTAISSQAYAGITIMQPLVRQEPYIIVLNAGYLSSGFYGGEDFRNDSRILESLKKSGKLIEKLTVDDIKTLPSSMKGYELYSWQSADEWNFCLITGTNRNKTVAEIISGERYISESGWVNVQAVGVKAIEKVLGKMPQGGYVFWLSGLEDPAQPGLNNISLPPENIVTEIAQFAQQSGLNLAY